jgi:uncharacterized protein (TIRG00374 family)
VQVPSDKAGRSLGRAVRLGLGLVISAIFLYATVRTVPIDKVGAALAGAKLQWILISLGFVALAYALKIYRWVAMLRSLGSAVRLGTAAVPFLGGVAFNNVLPFRAGDVIRVMAFQRFTGIPASGQIGTLVLERLLDLFVLMAFLFATITYLQTDVLDATLLAGLKLAALAVAVAISYSLRGRDRFAWWSDGRRHGSRNSGRLARPFFAFPMQSRRFLVPPSSPE